MSILRCRLLKVVESRYMDQTNAIFSLPLFHVVTNCVLFSGFYVFFCFIMYLSA